ncbi:hypothetical protein BRC81_06140 [Halobacteriales archaeon QS_1_68_20]|nr:MAG: hypothetical protein BRC81_06140 [Halobacteriales archaeon QS_1_68_20]
MSKQRDGGGRYVETVSDRELLHFFESGRRDFYSAREIAEEFGVDRSQAHRRLKRLADGGELERVEVGTRNVVWWRPRDVVALIDEGDGYSVVDPTAGVASQGDTRPQALRMLAEAIEARESESGQSPGETYAELGVDPEDVDEDAAPPWE